VPSPRPVLFAVVVSALLGFAAGWVARTLTWPTAEDRAEEAARELRDRIRSLGR
jgi:hypothetical protein